ncbi:mono/diheme cytochrome c family protein [Rhodopseudomonas julia]|uniref:Mono/diheme cytochrome c family protein n=1 Tax=Rhodopseudomonas julia TaxID=200617 RepID=A0ABU0C7Y6_9BRAD|nr:c-type cytochrome [Rhodopseudomonas julia]MDQ0326636.1 mono/diheme cytochrome c family protein [Rhodopseudomonas julia]
MSLPLHRSICACAIFVSLAPPALAAGDPQEGRAIAEKWCATCHVVSETQTSATPAAPSFAAIGQKYRNGISALAAFLADPHPVMPDMSLTRQEIRDLTAYIEGLRG